MENITYITVTVEDKIAQSDGTVYVCDNSMYRIRFMFDAEWEAAGAKTVRIKWGGSSQTETIDGDEIEVPVISGVQRFEVFITAGKLRTEKPAIVLCRESILGGGGTEDEPQEEDPEEPNGGITIIGVQIVDKIALSDGTPYVCDNEHTYRIRFDFDAEWEQDVVKTARFIYGNKYTDRVFEGNEVGVPKIRGVYRFEVGVYAGNTRVSTAAVVPCRRSVLGDDGTPDEPEPDVYSQIVDMLNEMFALYGPANVAKTIEAGLKAAKESGVFDGAPGYTPKKYVDYFTPADIKKITEDILENIKLQSKTATPTKERQSITPDSEYYGLSDVTMLEIPYAEVKNASSGVTVTIA